MKKVNCAKKITISLAVLSVLLLLLTSQTSAESSEGNCQQARIRLVVHILDIDQYQKTAFAEIYVFIHDFPYNVTKVNVWVIGAGDTIVSCNNSGTGANGWFYQGESKQVTWLLEGKGEAFPFDNYILRFRIYDIDFIENNFTLTSEEHQAFFDGPKAYSLNDLWHTNNNLIPINYVQTEEMGFLVQRSDSALWLAILEILVPIVACYYLLGATLILDPRKQLSERLRVYLSLFVFVPTFLFAIQKFLPYRTSLSFPEFLLVNLLISNAIFGIFSIVGTQKGSDELVVIRLHVPEISHSLWDLVAMAFSVSVFTVIYYLALLQKITMLPSLVFSFLILPAFVYWVFLKVPKSQLAKHKRFYSIFILPFLVPAPILGLLWLLYR